MSDTCANCGDEAADLMAHIHKGRYECETPDWRKLKAERDRFRVLLRETTDWLAAVVDMNGKRVTDFPAFAGRLAEIRKAVGL